MLQACWNPACTAWYFHLKHSFAPTPSMAWETPLSCSQPLHNRSWVCQCRTQSLAMISLRNQNVRTETNQLCIIPALIWSHLWGGDIGNHQLFTLSSRTPTQQCLQSEACTAMDGLSPPRHHVHMRRSVLGLTPPQLILYIICPIGLKLRQPCVKAIQDLAL